jgi:ADP-ribosylglycohydrolase
MFWSDLPLPGVFADPNYSARDTGKGNIPACDAAMMVPPVGLINACNPFQAGIDGYEVSLTCQSGYSASASCAVAAAVAEAMREETTVDRVVAAAIENTDPATAYCVRRAVALAEKCDDTAEFTRLFYEKDYLYTPVDVLEVVPAAIGLFVAAKGDLKETIFGGVNFGRDCDTIPGIAGAIAGAFHGIDAIPDDWVETVRDANPEPNLDEITLGVYKSLGAELLGMEQRTQEIRKIY